MKARQWFRRGIRLHGVAAGFFAVATLLTAAPVFAGKLSQAERAMLSDASQAADVVGRRIQQVRDIVASVRAEADQGGTEKKTEKILRRVEAELSKAQVALDGGDCRAAYDFAIRAAHLAEKASPEVVR